LLLNLLRFLKACNHLEKKKRPLGCVYPLCEVHFRAVQTFWGIFTTLGNLRY
jgi:hypothetical protein